MSTGYNNITAQRIAQLSRLGGLFHAHEIGLIWGIVNKNSLYTLLKRCTQAGLLHRIYKGLFSLVPTPQLDPAFLGAKALHRYVYLSLQSVLFDQGFITQPPQAFTFVSSVSKRFTLLGHQYLCRQLMDSALYNPCGVELRNGIYVAMSSRAVADLLYFNPQSHLDTPWRVDWPEVKKIQKQLSYPFTPFRYDRPQTSRRSS